MFTKLYVKGQILLNDLMKDQRGVTAIEYAIVAVAISGAVTLAFSGTGSDSLLGALKAAMSNITGQLKAVVAKTPDV